ncbi:hypothetical protein PybrP1_004830 [[Pythium] brassicae (nom. inval.)]|nr:hypothetical protein PybrP1_004830 [[Pythium] brassicae (nom. inval.)]
MRLTADVILRARVSVNPLRERELNLRGLKAPAIENLGVTKDGFDCIDLSDNEIKKLENFPRLRRLRMLLLHNNHIARLQEDLSESIANLEYLVLTGNRIAQLAELDRLAGFAKLDTLVLAGNPVTKRKYYREYVAYKLPQLKVLDYKKIKPHDREAAKVLFQSLAGQKIEQEAHLENGAEPSVASSTQAMEKVTIEPQPTPMEIVPTPMEIVAPPPPPAPVVTPPPAAQSPTTETATATTTVTVTATVEQEPDQQQQEEKEAAASTPPPQTPPKQQDDVAMEDADASEPVATEPAVPFTPSKPLAQMTVAALREELKRRGLSIKGLKAELVQRLKDATGA